jgi:hypothetical protein
MLPDHFRSYLKTLLLALGAGTAAILATHLGAQAHWEVVSSAMVVAGWVVGLGFVCLAASTIVVWSRDAHQRRTHSNLFQVLNRSRADHVLARGSTDGGLWLRRTVRQLVRAKTFVVGEVVEIRSYDEIVATLDADGCVNALPFQAEMRRFCGQRARIFRRVDKIYDYGRSKTLRRLDDVFLLTHLRCDGSAHGGCQAACYLMWKSAWLKHVDGSRARTSAPGAESPTESGRRYVCQFTQLAAASTAMSPLDFRQDLRPLLAGNLTLAAFCLGMMTRVFRRFQELRGGVGYPAMPKPAAHAPPAPPRSLVPGDRVRIRAGDEIARTLSRDGRNRGLWFDPDMLKYSGQSCVVGKRIERIIDDATGLMREMKSPCVVLEDVDYAGESLRFVAQEEHLYWREVWLALDAPRNEPGAETVLSRPTQPP